MRIQCILAFVVVSTTNTIGITTTTTTTEAALTTLPLIPHHIQKTRRLKELQEIHGRDLQMDDEDIFDSHLPPPSQQRRRNEAAQVGALYHGYGTHYADGTFFVCRFYAALTVKAKHKRTHTYIHE